MDARNNAGGKTASTTEAGFKHVIIGSALYLRLGTVVKFPGGPTTDDEFKEELLLQRTLSLYQEAQRWVDYRRFGKLAELNTLAQDLAANFTVATVSPLPAQECDSRARAGNPGGIPLSCPGNPIP